MNKMYASMSDHQLRHLIETRNENVQTMSSWSWKKTSKHLDLIEQQLAWAFQQRNEIAIARLEEFRRQVIDARLLRFDTEE